MKTNENKEKQKQLQITLETINQKETEIQNYKEKIEIYKKLNQKEEALEQRKKEDQALLDGLNKELEEAKETLENLKNEL